MAAAAATWTAATRADVLELKFGNCLQIPLHPGRDFGDVWASNVARECEHDPDFARLGSLADFVSYRMRPRK